MTYEKMIKTIEALGEDVSYKEDKSKKAIIVTIDDYGGFDDEWGEIDKDYENPDAVDAFTDILEEDCNSISVEYGIYTVYHFDDFYVRLGYTSYDI